MVKANIYTAMAATTTATGSRGKWRVKANYTTLMAIYNTKDNGKAIIITAKALYMDLMMSTGSNT